MQHLEMPNEAINKLQEMAKVDLHNKALVNWRGNTCNTRCTCKPRWMWHVMSVWLETAGGQTNESVNGGFVLVAWQDPSRVLDHVETVTSSVSRCFLQRSASIKMNSTDEYGDSTFSILWTLIRQVYRACQPLENWKGWGEGVVEEGSDMRQIF